MTCSSHGKMWNKINVVLPSSVNCPLQAPVPHCINNDRNSGLGFWQQHKFPDNIRFIKGHSPWCSLQLGVHFLDWRFRLKYQEILYRRNKCYYNSFHNWNVWRACCGMDEIPVVLDWHERWCHSSIRPWGQNTRILISLGLDEPRGIALDPERGWADVHEDIKINDVYRFIMFDRDPWSPPVN